MTSKAQILGFLGFRHHMAHGTWQGLHSPAWWISPRCFDDAPSDEVEWSVKIQRLWGQKIDKRGVLGGRKQGRASRRLTARTSMAGDKEISVLVDLDKDAGLE